MSIKMGGVEILVTLVLAFFSHIVGAADLESDKAKTAAMLIYIQPYEYVSEIKLQDFSQGYWFAPGPVLEQIAKEKLTASYGEVSVCDADLAAKVLVWLQPRMFYNGQLQVFYGEIKANIYSSAEKLVASYMGESAQQGSLSIEPDYWIERSFSKAMDDLEVKMREDANLQAIVADTSQHSALAAPCGMVALFPVPKIRFMSFY